MKPIFTLLFALCSYYCLCQKNDQCETGCLIDCASLAVKNLSDSSTVGAMKTIEEGKFVFKDLKSGHYLVYFLNVKAMLFGINLKKG